MEYTLMHKNRPVLEVTIDDSLGVVSKILTIYSLEHLPVGVMVNKGVVDRISLNEWWSDRCIPASRSGIQAILDEMDLYSTRTLLIKSFGLSLSDTYWILPKEQNLTWDGINFYDNPFSEDMGDILFGIKKYSNPFNFSSPDNSSDGNLKKRWKIVNGDRVLLKGGFSPLQQQPFNEVVACRVMKELGIPCVDYSIIWDRHLPYSFCRNFTSPNLELIPAWRILKTQKKNNNVSWYRHFLNCCENLGIPDVRPFMDRMITVDYLIANEDRHFNNFGVLRNPETLEWIGMAPVYDSGSSLGYQSSEWQLLHDLEVPCKPFKAHHEEQLKLVQDLDWLNTRAFVKCEDILSETLRQPGTEMFWEGKRVNILTSMFHRRCEQVVEYSQNMAHIDLGLEDDLKENTAASYQTFSY